MLCAIFVVLFVVYLYKHLFTISYSVCVTCYTHSPVAYLPTIGIDQLEKALKEHPNTPISNIRIYNKGRTTVGHFCVNNIAARDYFLRQVVNLKIDTQHCPLEESITNFLQHKTLIASNLPLSQALWKHISKPISLPAKKPEINQSSSISPSNQSSKTQSHKTQPSSSTQHTSPTSKGTKEKQQSSSTARKQPPG